jgi:serine/threonine protein kinase/Flp pilus assembly protein TadD
MENQHSMTPARWRAITKIFESALDKPPLERKQFIQQACEGDSELESEVWKLLGADEDAGNFLERPALASVSPRPPLDRQISFLTSGSLISGRFEILRFIGQGGMGQVYEALDTELKAKVALKTIHPNISSDPHTLARFRREVELTRRITHPNVCRTFDIERHTSENVGSLKSDVIFLTMELLEGETLASSLSRQKSLTPDEALPLVLQMIQALNAAHSVGIIHRDFKPSNVLLVPSTSGRRVVVTDFGLARAFLPEGSTSPAEVANSLSNSEGLLGTLIYMAPEQLQRGEATVASDIYALGLVMFEMVTLRRPFADSMPFAEAVKRITKPAPSPRIFYPELDTRWDTTIRKCLEVEPAARFESVLQIADALRRPPPDRSGVSRIPQLRETTHGVLDPQRANLLRRRALPIAVILLLVALFVFVLRRYEVRRDGKLVAGSTMLLTQIRNGTGDPRFDSTTELLRHQLSQSPHFALVEPDRVQNVLAQMKKPNDSSIDPATAREVALRVGAPRVIFGGISRVGDSYILDIAIEQPDNNPRRPRALWESHWTWNSSAETAKKEIPSGFLSAVRDGTDWIRSEVGESANDIASVNIPPEDVTTGNWSALAEFTQAETFKAAARPEDAVLALQNAVAEDPEFALAYARLGDIFISLSRYEDGYHAYQLALAQDRKQRLTRRERDRLEGIYASDALDFSGAEAAFREYAAYYPNDYAGWFYRAYPLMMMGRTQEALVTLKKAAAIDPAKMFAPAHIARFDLISEDFDDASKWIQHLRDTGHLDDANLVDGQSNFLQGRYPEALADFGKMKESTEPVYRSYAHSLLARTFAELGQYQNALRELNEGMAADLASGDGPHRSDKLLDRAYIDFRKRNYEDCEQDVEAALQLNPNLQTSLAAATLLGRAASESVVPGRTRLRAQLRELAATLPNEDFKPMSDIVRARVRGEVFLVDGDWKAALQEFENAAALEPAVKDKEYLARARLEASKHAADSASAKRLIDESLAAYSVLAMKPGQIWQWALDYPPGYFSDTTLAYIKAASLQGTLDGRTKNALRGYLSRRANADEVLNDIQQARQLRARFMSGEPN